MRLWSFANTIAGRLLIAAVCIAAVQAAIAMAQRRTRLQADQAATFDVGALPPELGRWLGRRFEVDPKILMKMGALQMVNCSYENDVARQAAVHLATFSTADVLAPHTPQQCFTEDGWTILKDDWKHDSTGRRYRQLLIEREAARTMAVYWYQLGTEVAGDRDDIRRILQRFRLHGTPFPPLVKVLVEAPIVFADADAAADCEDLGAAIFDWVKKGSE
jgi:hypothetical protein